MRAETFTDMIGVNTHLSWQGPGLTYDAANQTNIRNALQYLGVEYVRDGVPYAGWTLPFYQTLANDGIKFNLLPSNTDYENHGDSFNKSLRDIEGLAKTHPNSVSIEGLNEINTWPVTYQGQSTATNLSVARDVQAQLVRESDAIAATANLPIVNLSVGGISPQQASSALGNMSDRADAGNWHSYFSGGQQPGANIASGIAAAKAITPSDPVQITETGYYTAVNDDAFGQGSGVSPEVQAKLSLNLVMEAAKGGAQRVFFYELMDNNGAGTPGRDSEASFGLFNANGTAKPVAHAIHNLNVILGDNGANNTTFAERPFDYTLTGMPSTGDSMVIQESNGQANIVVWAEPDIWNESARSAIAAPNSPVTVKLAQAAQSIKVYDPLTGTTPIATANNTDTITINVSDHPLIVEASGAATATIAKPTVNNDTITGDATNNVLVGLAGNDVINGGAGNDWINGGPGTDTLTGGAGADRFVVGAVEHGVDTITDFNSVDGDRLELRSLLGGFGSNYTALQSSGHVKLTSVSDGMRLDVDETGGADSWSPLVLFKGATASNLQSDFLIA